MLSHEDLAIGPRADLLGEVVVVGDGLLPDLDHVLKVEHPIRPQTVLNRLDCLDSHYYQSK